MLLINVFILMTRYQAQLIYQSIVEKIEKHLLANHAVWYSVLIGYIHSYTLQP